MNAMNRWQLNTTYIDSEEVCRGADDFNRKALAFHAHTQELVRCKAAVADTYFTISATTETEHGYIVIRDDNELQFRPDIHQNQTPAEFRRTYKKA